MYYTTAVHVHVHVNLNLNLNLYVRYRIYDGISGARRSRPLNIIIVLILEYTAIQTRKFLTRGRFRRGTFPDPDRDRGHERARAIKVSKMDANRIGQPYSQQQLAKYIESRQRSAAARAASKPGQPEENPQVRRRAQEARRKRDAAAGRKQPQNKNDRSKICWRRQRRTTPLPLSGQLQRRRSRQPRWRRQRATSSI